MIDQLNLEQFNWILSIVFVSLSIGITLYKIRKTLYKPFIFIFCRFYNFFKLVQNRSIEELFQRLKPIIHSDLKQTLDDHKHILQQQSITLATYSADTIELRNTINSQLSRLQETLTSMNRTLTETQVHTAKIEKFLQEKHDDFL